MISWLEEKEQCTCVVCGDLYTDPKRLECGHLFCLQCLLERDEQTCPDPDCREEMESSVEKPSHLQTDPLMVDRIKTLVRNGLYPFGMETIQAGKKTSYYHARMGKLVRKTYHCDGENCKGKRNIHGISYRCSVCEDFDMCEPCANLPRHPVHNIHHVMMKLKRGLTLSTGRGPYIPKDAFQTLDNFSDNDSRVVHEGKTCGECGIQSISGTRFKCGMCSDYNLCEKCEEKSLEFHNEYHVFLVLPHPCRDPPPGALISKEFFDKAEPRR